MQHSERHDRDLVVDPLWKSQPLENCKSVGDVVISTKTKHQTSRSIRIRVGHGLGPFMGLVGLGWVRVFLIFGGLGWVGWRLDCVIFLTS